MTVVNNYTRWTEEEDKLLVQLHNQGMPLKQMARILSRTVKAIKGRKAFLRAEHGIDFLPYNADAKLKNHLKKWLASDINKLINMTEMRYPVVEIAETLQRTVGAVRKKQSELMLNGIIDDFAAPKPIKPKEVNQKQKPRKRKPVKAPKKTYAPELIFGALVICTSTLITFLINYTIMS